MTYERFTEIQAVRNLQNRLAMTNPNKFHTDMINMTPDISLPPGSLAPGTLNYMRPNTTIVDHAVHDAYMVNEGQPVFVANAKMVLKKHTTKTMTVFTRDQLVIGERMKHWLPFEFAGVEATPIQLFDVGYYVFETENKKWPHMIVAMAMFEEQMALNPELEAIKKGLAQLGIDEAKTEADGVHAKEKEAQEEENAKNISEMKKYLGWNQKPSGSAYQDNLEGQAVEYFKRMAEDITLKGSPINPINPDDLGPVIPPLSPLTEKQEAKMKRTQKCPDCATKDQWLEGPSGGMSTNMKCGNCGSKFNVSPFGFERI